MMANNPISRRTLLTVLAGSGATALVGCDPGRSPSAAPAAPVPDPLLVEVDGGLGVLRGTDRQTMPHSVATADGLAVFATAPEGADTALWRIDTATGRASARVTLPGRWVPQTVSTTGTTVALTSTAVHVTTGRPDGREVTPVLIADETGVRHRLNLRGNFVPETFTEDLGGLFVLEWLPATAPDRYRVRVVDLATRKPGPLSTRNKVPVPPGAEEEMRGDGRQAVLSPNRRTLYTLYTHQPDHRHTRDLVSGRPGNVHAFVHTLSLGERWAYCIDLPHPFGEAPAGGHAMAITPDGSRLFVADVTSGTVAEISTEDLTVRRTATVPGGTGTAHAAADRDRLVIAADRTVRTLDLTRLGVVADRTVGEPVTGLVFSADGQRLYVGQTDAVSWHDAGSGAELGRVAVPGLVALHGLAGRA
ncbi:YncE family protein [Micromonospora sp. NPDC049497]|uniref:YncE family protein n=1 Tax=Micromonospora sp. NPDC049497 TaxID=3364273 RepID=UPI0037ABAEB9